ncbi:MAG: hypothetical protein ABFD54_04430 [Armatimonadota bacterium]
MAKTWKSMSYKELDDLFEKECTLIGYSVVNDFCYKYNLDRAKRLRKLCNIALDRKIDEMRKAREEGQS